MINKKLEQSKTGLKRERRNSWDEWKTNSKMVNLNPTITIITINVNCLNNPIERQKCSYWIKKQDSTICFL